MSRNQPDTETKETIAGNRRKDRRYEINLRAKWKLIRRRRVLDAGEGSTLDLSSGGLLLNVGRKLPTGLNVEVSITWPVLLHGKARLQLVAVGRIVRASGHHVAVRSVQHEFRTVGRTETANG
jgi:hypothetical protein